MKSEYFTDYRAREARVPVAKTTRLAALLGCDLAIERIVIPKRAYGKGGRRG